MLINTITQGHGNILTNQPSLATKALRDVNFDAAVGTNLFTPQGFGAAYQAQNPVAQDPIAQIQSQLQPMPANNSNAIMGHLDTPYGYANYGPNGQINYANEGGYNISGAQLQANPGILASSQPPPSGGPQPQPKAAPQPTTGPGGKPLQPGQNVNEFQNGWRWDGSQWQPPAGTGTGTDQATQDQINSIFSGQQGYLENLRNVVLPQNLAQNQQFINTQYQTAADLLPGEQQQLLQPIQQNRLQFGQGLQSAADAATRAFRAYQQQGNAMFGAGSSAGGAINDLAYQAFLQGQNQLSQQGASGQLQFAGQEAQVGQFIAQKKADLGMWKNQANETIINNFNDQIMAINQDETLNEQAKQQARLDVLQNSVNQNKAVQLADMKFQQDLQLFQNISNPNQISGQQMQNAPMLYAQGQQMLQDINQQPVALSFGNTGQFNPQQQLAGGFTPIRTDFLNIAGGVGGNPNQQQQQQAGIPG